MPSNRTFFSGNDYEGVNNGDCADVGIDEHAQFEFTVTADECFSEQKELVRNDDLIFNILTFVMK